MEWSQDGGRWPNRDASRFVAVPPHRWHVQVAGAGPDILLLHGAGGATQSWRHLFPLLGRSYRVIAPDLPGQGFTRLGARMRCGLTNMGDDLARLCDAEGWAPDAIIGHSAGAALALDAARRGVFSPKAIIGLNAALDTFDGIAGWLFPLMARFMAINPLVPPLLARMAGGRTRVAELLASTGSTIDQDGIELYRKLMTDSRHIDGTLAMMAAWKIESLLDQLGDITLPVLLIAGAQDGTVPPKVSERAAGRMPLAEFHKLDGLGHLAHEEDAGQVAELIETYLSKHLVPAEGTARPA